MWFFDQSVRIELFKKPSKPPGCDFKKWIDDTMTEKDMKFAGILKKVELEELREKTKGASTSK